MWGERENPDPGGAQGDSASQESSELKDESEQQFVAHLKQILRKEQSNVSQDKVEEYVNTLNRARAKRAKLKKSESTPSSSTSSTVNIDANKKERVNLLRQQLEENKAKLAQRGKSQKGIEEMVTQLQAQLKDSQQTLVSLTSQNISLVESKPLDYNENTSQKELYNILLIKERKITELSAKSQKLEGTILDLQENLKEKDSVIDARTKAITLMTDSLSKKGRNTLDALEETKGQMREMQENFIKLEEEMKARQLSLLNDLKYKNNEIRELEATNSLLKKENFELQEKYSGRLSPNTYKEADNQEVLKLQQQIELLTLENANQKKIIEEQHEISKQNNKHLARISELEAALNSFNLDDLRIGSSTYLVEENKKLRQQIEEYLLKIQDLEYVLSKKEASNSEYVAKIEQLEKQLNERVNLISSSVLTSDDNEELQKLKKQLDESNKNMIKMRVTQKGKIKELNKKLDQFRKMNDANALVGQLQNEITKLNEKIAELEEEKGNLQLKMVDSVTSSKEDSEAIEEELKKLKEDYDMTKECLDEKDKVIELLEAEVLSLKADLKLKTEEEVKVSSQVSSEMSSICYEEQIEVLNLEKKKLFEQLDEVHMEKETLCQELEFIKKEKAELNSKLESYIQENMELIDKLEKLSAEKVSSVESIEIVEGLTQQEKLELAAYQKHLNPEETLKLPDEDLIETPVELNESVLQLSEDTADLLQKIDMFTQERKEVMHKMEALKEDNNALSNKIKEIENNRDILEETYEQLQNEKEQILNEKQELSGKLEQLQKNYLSEQIREESANTLSSAFNDLQLKYETLIQENDKLKYTLKDFDSIIQEKYNLEERLQEAIENNATLNAKLNTNLDEINNYQLIIEENKTEFVHSADTINKLQSQLEEREQDIQELHININELNSVINELQAKETNFELIESELVDLKATLKDQITIAADYEAEIAENSETIKRLNDELAGLSRKVLELENELELKDDTLEKLRKEIDNKNEIIKSLQSDIEEKDRSFKVVSEDIKGKYLQLQGQLESNDGSLQKQISELSDRNKEQLEKIKKLAANLKKKIHAYQELQSQLSNEQEKWENENREKQTIIADLKEQIETLRQNNVDQQHYIQEFKQKEEKLLEMNLQKEMCASLHEEIPENTSLDISVDKIRELELLVETNESELNHYKERFNQLQEDLTRIVEFKSELEVINSDLVEKLNAKTKDLEEKSLLQDRLEAQLIEFTKYNEELSIKLHQTQNDYEEFIKKNQEQDELVKKLKVKLKKAHDKVTELKSLQENTLELETINQSLRNQIACLEDNQKHIQNENESLQKQNMSDYEKIEADYQIQLAELLKLNNNLAIDNEKLSEKLKELEDKEQEQNIEFAEHLKKIEDVKTEELRVVFEELDVVKSQNNSLIEQLNERESKLQEYVNQIQELRECLEAMKAVELNIESLKSELTVTTNERDSLRFTLNDINIQHQEVLNELHQYKLNSNESHVFEERILKLTNENKSLYERILALEFANSSLEASCESSQQLQMPLDPQELSESQRSSVKILPGLEALNVNTPEGIQQFSEMEDLKKQLHEMQRELNMSLQQIADLKQELEKYKRDSKDVQLKEGNLEVSLQQDQKSDEGSRNIPLFNAFADPNSSSVFDNIVTTESVNQIQQEPQPYQSNNWSEIQENSSLRSPIIEEGREALLKKIKALEFLLYNVDKEKEIALDQCTEMVNELTQLIYDQASNEGNLQKASAQKNFEQASAVINKDSLRTLDMETQIMCEKEIDELASQRKEPQKLEFETVDHAMSENQYPVVEPLIKPKQAYLCYTKEDKPQSLEAFDEHDDGWAWGPDEARLEAEHITTIENTPQVKNLLIEVQQFKDTIRVLQIERDNHLGEIKQLQIKCGKLLKKCKELKAKTDQTDNSKKPQEESFFDLNETIQEELKTQVQQLEKQLKELSNEYEKEKQEKGNLLKRVDVLVAANDRLTEMKEIQDSEVLRWQRKCEEALQKVQDYEWSSDGFNEEKRVVAESSSNSENHEGKIKELEETIRDLTLDNEELQTLLEEQTAKRLEAEKNKMVGNNEEISELQQLNENLHKDLSDVKLKMIQLQSEATNEKQILTEEKAHLEFILQQKENILEQLKKEELENRNALQEKNQIIEDLQNKIVELNDQQLELGKTISDLHGQLNLKNDQLNNIEPTRIAAREFEIVELTSRIEHLNSLLNEKTDHLVQLQKNLDHLNSEIVGLQRREVEFNNLILKKDEELARLAMEKEDQFNDLQRKIITIQENELVINDLQSKIREIELVSARKQDDDLQNQELNAQLEFKSQEVLQLKELLRAANARNEETHQLEAKTIDLNQELDVKLKEIELLKAEITAKDEHIKHLVSEIQIVQQDFQEKINELNENWQIQVDQRGESVAESWKLHLEMVEKDFGLVQEKLQSNIQELEEKRNLLVIENEELRKNVDQEIQNEIDKMSTLQQEIINLQQTIVSLNQTNSQKDQEIQEKIFNYTLLENELQQLRNENAEKENKLAKINIIIETTQRQFDEKREVVEEIVFILEKRAATPISYEKADIINEFRNQLAAENEKDVEITTLKKQNQGLEEKLNRLNGEKSREITGLNQVIEDLEKELTTIHQKDAEIGRLGCELNNILQEKQALEVKNHNINQELEKVKLEHSNCSKITEDCNRKIQESYNLQETLQQHLDEKNSEINALNQRILQIQLDKRNDSNKIEETLTTSLEHLKEEYKKIQDAFADCRNELSETQHNLTQKTQDLQLVNDQLIQYQQSLSYYEQENNALKDLVESKKQELAFALERNQFSASKQHYEELLSAKDIDINTLRQQYQELFSTNQNYAQRLNEEVALRQHVEQQLQERTQLVDEDTKQLEELKLIIEDQVVKIEQLKKELFDKSNQYDSLIAEMDVGRVPVTRQPTTTAETKRQLSEDDLSEPASRAELDLALYMLHQRDVRCEELTVELTQLLEERDTLQLRLSNAIREKEELRQSITADGSSTTLGSLPVDVDEGIARKSASDVSSSMPTDLKDSIENEKLLATKLSELKNVGYKKDKTFVDEQEVRRLQQLSIMQQHINEASKLPPEAAAKLVDASYTLSRDVQSPSKVLLNWLWGKNPPKANES
ncbi:hypothetical protein ABEB36_004410 [Hypothenemus hampei]|uniref:Protein lava lamp-like n=1 Tax=Hypothenemus hampei TaxID=57062 RepID=A0ABD1F3A0_HYPHA